MQSSRNALQDLRRESQRRKRIRASLAEWARLAGFEPAAHHRLLISALEDVAAGRTRRLMVLMPPGSAKSTYASVLFPPWWFAQHPASAIIAASHTADLAQHFGRQVRALVREHGPRLGVELALDSRAAGRWRTDQQGSYFAVGVRGPITGQRADLVIVDDPVKSHAEADSAAARERLWNWYRSDLLTRLRPGGRVVLIMTRWHEDDLGGRLLARQPEDWRCLRLPALAEAEDPLGRQPGEPLWPEWEDMEALLGKRAQVGPRVWSALFQQNPHPPDGGVFDTRRIDTIDTAPRGTSVRAWDLAASAQRDGADPDWSVGIKLCRDEAGRFVVLDIVRLRGSPAEVENAIVATAHADGADVPVGLPQDPGAAGKIALQAFARRLAGFAVRAGRETGSKLLRATPVAAQVGLGNLALLRGAWNAVFLDELRDFPHGAKDDQVDALARAFGMLIDASGPTRRVAVPLLAR